MKKSLFPDEGHFYRGNLHAHTTCSDGELTPEETVEAYRHHGYDFTAVTDHNKWGDYRHLGDEDFLVLPGVEMDTVYEGAVHHIVGIGRDCALKNGDAIPESYRKNVHPQRMIDYLQEKNCMAIYAHPFWSYCDMALLASLRGLTGMEIINYSCEQTWKSGISEIYFDYVWRQQSSRMWAFGSDDAHGHSPDYFGGSITVKAPALTADAILSAIDQGNFYASYTPDGCKAPEIQEFYVEDGVAYVRSSPCRNIYLIASRTRYRARHHKTEPFITQHQWDLPPDAEMIKCVLVDFNGSISWSQPIVLKSSK
ncbi:MAG: PHP domain-containing protein [Clostridia bacterium]|nr:PHP domain-containing protein [Clostridia bacterium]